MNYEVQGVIPTGRPQKTWSEVTERLSDPTNMRERCYGSLEMKEV